MGLLAWLRGPLDRGEAPVDASARSLFDEDFQRRLEMLAIVSRRVISGRMRAERRSNMQGSGVEFADHRDYVPGDDYRHIDWNVYQRFGRLVVRRYEEEEDLSIYFVLDTSGSMAFRDGRKLEHARRLCAALSYVALANLDRVTIFAGSSSTTERLATTRGKAQVFKIFRFLDALRAEGPTNLRETLRTFAAQHKRRGVVVLVSDLYDPAGFQGAINELRFNRFEPYVLHLVDPADARPPPEGDVRVVDCETGSERQITLTRTLLARFGRAYDDYLASVERFCATKQVPYLRASVLVPFDELVLQILRRGGLLH